MTRYNVLAIVAVVTVPLAPAILFGWNLYNYLMGKGVPVWLAIVGGVAGAVSLEAVGILAGHVGMVYLKRRDWRVLFPAIAMLFYAGYGYVKTPEYGGVFILAALVYVLVALQGEADTAVKQELADTAVHLAFDLEQEAADREHAREMEAKRLELQAQNDLQMKIAHEQAQVAIAEARAKVNIANAEARKVAKESEISQKVQGKAGETAGGFPPLSGKAQEIYNVLAEKPDMSNTQVGELVGVSRQYVGQVKRSLNGSIGR